MAILLFAAIYLPYCIWAYIELLKVGVGLPAVSRLGALEAARPHCDSRPALFLLHCRACCRA
jgi:hypothetical protein